MMSGIRLGDIPDIDAIVELALEVKEQSVYAGIKLDNHKFRLLVASMMGDKTSRVIVIVDDDDRPQGFLLGLVEELFFSRSRYATDLAVYVRKGYRNLAPAMFKQFMQWAKTKPRVVRIMFGISSGVGDPARTGKMYQSLGLSLCGGIYSKEVQSCQA
jgi:hypothetical protein